MSNYLSVAHDGSYALFIYTHIYTHTYACMHVFMYMSHLVFFLLQVNRAQTIPSVVMPVICSQSATEACHGFVEVFVAYVLMPSQGVRIRKSWAHLRMYECVYVCMYVCM